MQVAALQQFLRSLGAALEAAGDGRAAARGLDEACRALEPFRSLALPEFAAFLNRADEYRRTGSVRVPGPADLRGERLTAALGRLAAARDRPASELTATQTDVAHELVAIAREAGLAGSLAPDPQWAIRIRVAPHLKAIRDLAARITSPTDYAGESVRTEIGRLEAALDHDAVKAVAAEFGVKVTAATKPAKLLAEVLTKLSGHSPEKVKAAGRSKSAAPPVDTALVEAHARRLGSLVARSADPDAVPEAEIDAELARLKGLPKPALIEVVTRGGIDGVKPKDAVSAILLRVRNRLTAARRARERAEV